MTRLKHNLYQVAYLIQTKCIDAILIQLKNTPHVTPHPRQVKHIFASMIPPYDIDNPRAYVVDSGDVHLDPSQTSGAGTRILPLTGERSSMTQSTLQSRII